jgi:SNF2 family DNA or RNA helicase
VQVLALLDQRHGRRARSRSPKVDIAPSLAVVPRSLVFNWIEEAKRFAPQLRVLNYTGLGRSAGLERMSEYDLIVTTYGTLRRDIAKLSAAQFDYAILDEAQAIKNASSQAAKACRLLRARRRLAMTGTPLENHLGELWSLFEFLNPGMLGQNQKLNQCFSTGRESGRSNGKNGSSDRATMPAAELAILSQALRPFLLRRTKQEVLAELPAKLEQTLFCELENSERKRYDELRDHYRQSLQQRIAKVGVNRAKIHVLEALLRLRQAACHPGLLDKNAGDAESAKLEMLLDQLSQVIDEGHKALVFSQFTSFLAIVRRHLDRRKIVYEYLDGKTARRQSKVERFQSDPACPLFLISLKAGGQGLNLTAADYVFILDPWWNPAVEAQAVDRAHRIGQNRPVFAYRLIARNTVEEKILQLQKHKRDLAAAIVSADNSPLRNLTAEDLQLLLG